MFKKIFNFDFIYLAGILLLLAVGLIALYSIFPNSTDIFWKQFVLVLVGLVLFFYLGNLNYGIFKNYSTLLYFLSVGILVVVLIFGDKTRGTVGWLNLGFTKVQPVEFVKICLIIFLAHFIEDKKVALGELNTIISSFILVSVIGFLILWQPDFGSALVIYGIWFGMIFISGISKKYLTAFLIFGMIISVIAWFFLLKDYQKDRITNFVNSETTDVLGSGWNVHQSVVAVGNGGFYGRGIGYGSQSQLNFLPEKHTDFIFATIVEATGLIGACFVLSLFLLIFIRFRFIADSSRDSFGYFLVSGVMTFLFIHVLINIGMNMKVMPVTGIPLPFVSYGGSSIISVLIACGIVMNVYVKKETNLGKVITDY